MWNQVDLNARTVRLNSGTTKNDAGQIVALDGELLEAIQAQWEKRRVVTIPGESLILLPYVFDAAGSVSKTIVRQGTRRKCARDEDPSRLPADSDPGYGSRRCP